MLIVQMNIKSTFHEIIFSRLYFLFVTHSMGRGTFVHPLTSIVRGLAVNRQIKIRLRDACVENCSFHNPFTHFKSLNIMLTGLASDREPSHEYSTFNILSLVILSSVNRKLQQDGKNFRSDRNEGTT